MKNKILISIISVFMLCAYACNTTTPTDNTNNNTAPAVEEEVINYVIPEAPSGHVQTKFKLVWSIYVGWNPWHYAKVSNVLSKWGKKYGIEIELSRLAYIPSIEAYNAKQFDACVMTNMDLLTIPINSGTNSTVLGIGDFSNGNDGVETKDSNITNLSQVREIYGVKGSVSEYVVFRGQDKYKIPYDAIEMTNTSEDEITSMFTNNKNMTIVTWNPHLMNCRNVTGAKSLFSSADIPGEILDLLVVNTAIIEKNPDFGRALIGAWYEVMGVMSAKDAKATNAIEIMAKVGESSVIEFNNQLTTTAMFYTPQSAIDFSQNPEFNKNMERVKNFCIKYDMLKDGSSIGMQMPNGQILGPKDNVQLKFDMSYTSAAAAGKL